MFCKIVLFQALTKSSTDLNVLVYSPNTKHKMPTNGGLFQVSLSDRFNLPPSSSSDRVFNFEIFPEDVHVKF